MTKVFRKAVYITLLAAPLAISLPLGKGNQAWAQLGLGGPLDRGLGRGLPGLGERLDPRLDRRLEKVRDAAADTAEAAEEPAVPQAAGELNALADDLAVQASGVGLEASTVLMRDFFPDVDERGFPIEKNVLIVLVDSQDLAALGARGLEIVQSRPLHGLDMNLLTLRARSRDALLRSAQELRASMPDTTLDFNHLYQFATDSSTAADVSPQAVPADHSPEPQRIGIVDSAVAPGHAALGGHTIVARDFVKHAGDRPQSHGTAVASLLTAHVPGDTAIYASSVFFQLPGRAPGASTESLIEALDWLLAEEVPVISMSLAGPPDAVLEQALQRVQSAGTFVVAAVGNNGPGGGPLYPAAYESVIGVTAVDQRRRIFPYANRGPHVAFSAIGVDARVADSRGGWRVESGTSMAAPLVAAALVSLRTELGNTADPVLETLIGSAEDLGRAGHDEVFGHGLIRPRVWSARARQNTAARLSE